MFDQAQQQAINERFKGRTLDQATRAEIQETFQGLHINEVEWGWMVTADFRTDRVRVWYDGKTKVIQEVSIG